MYATVHTQSDELMDTAQETAVTCAKGFRPQEVHNNKQMFAKRPVRGDRLTGYIAEQAVRNTKLIERAQEISNLI